MTEPTPDDTESLREQVAEDLARLFHETYERLAPAHGYQTRKESAVPWDDVPAANKSLMIAVAAHIVAVRDAEVVRLRGELAETQGKHHGVACWENDLLWDQIHERAGQAEAERDRIRSMFDALADQRDALKAAINELLGQRAVLLAVIDGAREIAAKVGRTGERITIALALPPMPLPPILAALDPASGTDSPKDGKSWLDKLADMSMAAARAKFGPHGEELCRCGNPDDCSCGTDNPQEDDRNVPDRIDYDHDGELDDVVVNDCMAHLERLDAGRWYLGLYGSDGRTVQIDIASKTGRAEVTGFVTYSEGIAPDLERWAKSAPESPQDARTTPDPTHDQNQPGGGPQEDA